jgi:choice-of-anchor B domain-containing protein
MRRVETFILLLVVAFATHSAADSRTDRTDESENGPLSQLHPDEQHEQDNQDPYVGPGWNESSDVGPALAFPSHGVTLRSWIPLGDFHANATDGNDCWGYTSASGREYAFIGLNNGTGVAEITDPGNATIIAHLPGVSSIWRDIKTYLTYAYSVSEGGGGIQVFDLAAIDSGTIVNLGSVTTGTGSLASHNIAINEQSARLYRVGGGTSPTEGLRIYSLANPAVPAFLGTYTTRYCHDAQIVTWTEEPFVGVEVAFCYAGNNSGGGSPGIEILDVSDPTNITVIGSINLTLPPIYSHPASYSHQGWLSPDRRYVYFNDEIDEAATGNPTTTRILDVQDLTNPTQVAIFTNSTAARDHNLYMRDSLIYQANYRSGLRVLDASQPLALTEIGFFDTYIPDDNAAYNGLWSVYPYFPSGTVIGSDIEEGLFVWSVAAAQLPALSARSLLTLISVFTISGAYVAHRLRSSAGSSRSRFSPGSRCS